MQEKEAGAWSAHLAEVVCHLGSVRLVNCLKREGAKGTLPAQTVYEFVALGDGAEEKFLKVPGMGKKTFVELVGLVSIFCDNHGLGDLPEAITKGALGSDHEADCNDVGVSVALSDVILAYTDNARLRRAVSGLSAASFPSLSLGEWLAMSESERIRMIVRVPGLGATSYSAVVSSVAAFQNRPISLGSAQSHGSIPGDDRPALDYHAAFDECIGFLKPREKEIISARLMRQLTLEEVGQSFGLTRERIRQLEHKALRRFSRSFRSLTNEKAVESLKIALWKELSGGGLFVLKESEKAFQRRCSYPVLVSSVALFGSITSALGSFCIDYGQVWVYGIDKQELDASEKKLFAAINYRQTPIIFCRLISDAGINDGVAECIIAASSNYRLYRNIVVENPLTVRKRRLVSVLHLLTHNYQSGPVRLIDLHQRYIAANVDDPCSPRDILIVLQDYPSMFQRAGTFGWINLNTVVPIDTSRPRSDSAPSDEIISESESLSDNAAQERSEVSLFSILLETVESSPLPYREIAERVRVATSGKYSFGSVSAILGSYPEFDFFAPGLIGLYKLRDDHEYIRRGHGFLLDAISARQYVLAQIAGSPRLEYPCWNGEYFQMVAEWLYENGRLSELRSLMESAKPNNVYISQAEMERFSLIIRSTPARISLPDSPDISLEAIAAKHILKASWSAVYCESFHWMAANRVSGERLDSYRRGPSLIALLVAIGILRPNPLWYESHALADASRDTLLEMLAIVEEFGLDERQLWGFIRRRFRFLSNEVGWTVATQHEFASALERKLDSSAAHGVPRVESSTSEASAILGDGELEGFHDFLLDEYL